MPVRTFEDVYLPSFLHVHTFTDYKVKEKEVEVKVNLANDEEFLLFGTKYGTGFAYPKYYRARFSSGLIFAFPTAPPTFLDATMDDDVRLIVGESVLANRLYSMSSVYGVASFERPNDRMNVLITAALERIDKTDILFVRSDMSEPILTIKNPSAFAVGTKPGGRGLVFTFVAMEEAKNGMLRIKAIRSNGWKLEIAGGEVAELPWFPLPSLDDMAEGLVDFTDGPMEIAIINQKAIYINDYEIDIERVNAGPRVKWGKRLWRIHNPILMRERYVLTGSGVAKHDIHDRAFEEVISFKEIVTYLDLEGRGIIDVLPSADGNAFLFVAWTDEENELASFVLYDVKGGESVVRGELRVTWPSRYMVGKDSFLIFGRSSLSEGDMHKRTKVLEEVRIEETEDDEVEDDE